MENEQNILDSWHSLHAMLDRLAKLTCISDPVNIEELKALWEEIQRHPIMQQAKKNYPTN